MAGYYDETTPFREPPGGGPPSGPSGRSPVNPTRLWSAGLATAVVAALIGLVGVLVFRAIFRIALYAPAGAGAFGGSNTVVLCVSAAVAALAATGLAHMLLLGTPRPLAYFGWIVGLLTTAAVVTPFLTSRSLGIAFAMATIYLVIGLAIGSLVSGAAASASRDSRRGQRQRFEIE